jgi:hypothetical protein
VRPSRWVFSKVLIVVSLVQPADLRGALGRQLPNCHYYTGIPIVQFSAAGDPGCTGFGVSELLSRRSVCAVCVWLHSANSSARDHCSLQPSRSAVIALCIERYCT